MHVSERDESEPPEFPDSYAAEFKKISGRWYFRMVNPGEILEVDALAISAEEWRDRPESRDPTWRPRTFGSLVLAVKVLC